jgi:hypothetical protein
MLERILHNFVTVLVYIAVRKGITKKNLGIFFSMLVIFPELGRRGTRIDYWWESQRERDH